jgi:hypothetical protein
VSSNNQEVFMFNKAVKEIRKDMDAAGKFMMVGSMTAGVFEDVAVSPETLVAVGFIGAGLWLIAKFMILLERADPGG